MAAVAEDEMTNDGGNGKYGKKRYLIYSKIIEDKGCYHSLFLLYHLFSSNLQLNFNVAALKKIQHGLFEVIGGKKLKGEITPQGAKNEALQVICAVLLTR